ncbi:DNA primase [Candidatus Thioglobus autotrophicus]|uniref:DNA primase n=1 Tax=Candidatus Thioglobus autotrophicus TaxID=1705394 RepID=UPI00299EEB03|nr:DNA primase [Candidatus Thioglobus autotrophicus]WPE16819.1 DNA primase [Candidatus Thioglobus autotrophicus]WPE18371.1 DNA primase [Candidatus Thioglobus autotrophicus]
MPYISQSFIDDLPNQVDIVDLINKRVPLKKSGSDYRAPCPFHGGKNRNFAVNAHKQFYHCFKCGESGGAISFIQKFDNLDFVEAIETIANECGLTIEYDSNTNPVDPRIERYRALSKKVGEFYMAQLRTSPAKAKAVDYAKSRGISGEIAKRFELGFATPSNKDLLLHFEGNEQEVADLKTLGLVKEGQYGDYDFFRDRLMFPIHNTKGNIIAFGGRAFDEDAKAKYLNSSESVIFSKSRELYGLYHARKNSRSMDYMLVVEGYMDVVALHQAGITKVVATLGTATSTEHLQILIRTTNTIVFCFDGDDAGRAAAWKALKITLSVIKAGATFKFLFLPDGEDPDSLVKKESAKAFEQRIAKAQTLSQFLFAHLQAEVDFDTIEGKTLFLEKATGLIKSVNYEAYQQQLLEGLAQVVDQNIDQVRSIAEQQAPPTQEPPPVYVDMEVDYENLDEVDMSSFTDDSGHSQPMRKPVVKRSNMKALMSKMITLLLNYPTLADSTIEVRVRTIENSQVLLELVRSAQMDEDISQTELIKPFQDKQGIFDRLKQLCTLEPRLSEIQAREEFLAILTAIENQQKSEQIKSSIHHAHTLEDQQKIMQGILKGKRKT